MTIYKGSIVISKIHCAITLELLYKTVLDIRQFEGEPQKVLYPNKNVKLLRELPYVVIFLYNLYIFALYPNHIQIIKALEA